MDNLVPILQNVSYGAIVIVFAWLAKLFADWRTKDIDDDFEVRDNNNFSIGIRRAGLYLGGMIAMAGVLTGASQGFVNDVVALAAYGVLSYALLFIARMVNDAIILHGLNNDDECKNCNTAVGVVEFGNYIATGLIINGCVSGSGGGMLQGIISTVVFFGIGQVVLLALSSIYEALTPFECLKEIGSNNTAASVMLAGKTIALGFILRSSVAGTSLGWSADIRSFAVSAVTGIILLLVFNKIIDKLFLPKTDLNIEIERDRNVAAVIVTQVATIGFAIIISTVV